MYARSRPRCAISITIPLCAALALSRPFLGVEPCSSTAFHRSFVILTPKPAKHSNSRVTTTQDKASSLVAALLVLLKFLQYRIERYDFLRIRLKSSWFNISSTVVGCCSAAGKTNTEAAQSTASPGVVIANSACCSLDVHNTYSRYPYHTRCNNRTVPIYSILGSICVVPLLCISSKRQWPLILHYISHLCFQFIDTWNIDCRTWATNFTRFSADFTNGIAMFSTWIWHPKSLLVHVDFLASTFELRFMDSASRKLYLARYIWVLPRQIFVYTLKF
jgi:hypothetical protein